MVKGGDDVITQRLHPDVDPARVETNNHHLRKFASEGLRTLVMAFREINEDDFLDFKVSHSLAFVSLPFYIRVLT